MSNSVCNGCSPGYNLQSGLCQSICGDGILAGTEQCDDNNNIDGDGCNADCTTGNNNGCPASSPYISPATGACSSTCPAGFFPNASAFSCVSCYYTCGTCTDSFDCTSCSSISHRTLNGTQCLPNSGFYDNGTNIAAACVSPCATCASPTQCLSCSIGFYLSSTDCLLCSSNIPFCLECDQSSGAVCTLCQMGYSFNSSTNAC